MGNYLVRGIPDRLQRAFKILCEKEGISMNKKLQELMGEHIRKTVEQMNRERPSGE